MVSERGSELRLSWLSSWTWKWTETKQSQMRFWHFLFLFVLLFVSDTQRLWHKWFLSTIKNQQTDTTVLVQPVTFNLNLILNRQFYPTLQWPQNVDIRVVSLSWQNSNDFKNKDKYVATDAKLVLNSSILHIVKTWTNMKSKYCWQWGLLNSIKLLTLKWWK